MRSKWFLDDDDVHSVSSGLLTPEHARTIFTQPLIPNKTNSYKLSADSVLMLSGITFFMMLFLCAVLFLL